MNIRDSSSNTCSSPKNGAKGLKRLNPNKKYDYFYSSITQNRIVKINKKVYVSYTCTVHVVVLFFIYLFYAYKHLYIYKVT